MKVVIAPDSFKGSLSSVEAAEVMKQAIHSVDASVETVLKPMADGGEGTLEALLKATNGEKVYVECDGPLGEKRESWYIELRDKTAVIEGANIAGLPLVPEEKRNPDNTTSYGIGEAIFHALERGNTSILITIGGSSTNDGGLGMLQALGMKTWRQDGSRIGKFGKGVLEVSKLDIADLDPRLKKVNIRIACDVDNPLTGPRGASHVYGPQKGATPDQVDRYDKALGKFCNLMESACGKQLGEREGAGAAGGLGFAFLAIGAELHSGAGLVAEAIDLSSEIENCDLVLTGEGQSDIQTLYGKAPGYVADIAASWNKPALLISGSLTSDVDKLNEKFVGCFSISNGPQTLETSMRHVNELLYQATYQLMHMIKTVIKE